MEPNPIDSLVSDPVERGTPRAALVDALFDEDVEQCRQLLDAHPELVNAALRHRTNRRLARPRDSAWGLFHEPTYQGMTPVVFVALAPRFREPRLHSRALSPASLAIMALLVERGAALGPTPGAVRLWAQDLLIEVCRDYDSPEALGLLVCAGADTSTRHVDDKQHTLLQVAAGRGAKGAVAFLLDSGVPMNYDDCNEINGTPLHWAAENAQHHVVRLLLGRGAVSDMEKLDWRGQTPLLCCTRLPAFVEAPDYQTSLEGRYPDREETIRLLVDAGADLAATDRQDLDWSTCSHEFANSPLGHVSSWGSADIIRHLASKGADVHSVGSEKGATPLHQAARDWNAAGVEALLDLGADPAAADELGQTPLHWAAMGRCLLRPNYREMRYDSYELSSPEFLARLAALDSTISRLVQHKTTDIIDLQDAAGCTALHYAASMKLFSALVLLLHYGANPALVDHASRTVLHHLADPLFDVSTHAPVDAHLTPATANKLAAALLTANHLNINHPDAAGLTALHLAAQSASHTTTALLLHPALSADPNQPDAQGSSPLHQAARRAAWAVPCAYDEAEDAKWSGRAARVRALLLEAGADGEAREPCSGWTAEEIVEEGRQEWTRGRERYEAAMAARAVLWEERAGGRGRGRGGGWEEAARRWGGQPAASGRGLAGPPTRGTVVVIVVVVLDTGGEVYHNT